VRVLVTGAGGVLGGRLALLLYARRYAVIAAWRASAAPSSLERVEVDLLEPAAAARLLERARPEAVVHAAALVEPDVCERQPGRAFAVNVEASERLAAACARRGVKLLLISTDLVFSDADSVRDEVALPHPVSVYGRTKRAAEQTVLAADRRHAVARVSLVVGRGHGPRGTATESLVWALRASRPLRLYTDQFRTPADPESVAAGCARILDRDAAGIYHLAGGERISRHELGRRVASLRGFDPGTIAATTHEERPPHAPRPKDVCLDTARTRAALDWTPRLLDAAIRESRPAPDIIPAPA
jgi:dTDP-4-dehydrorhamnose reductase